MDARIQQSVVANLSSRPAPVHVGPFVVGIDPATPNPGINYATPVPGAPITASDVTAMVKAFQEANRQPRLEYVTGCAPGLEALLLEAGFTVEARHEYLVCLPSGLVVPPAPDGVDLRAPSTDEERAAMTSAQFEAFSGELLSPDAVTADVARITRLQSKGGIALMAVSTTDGTCAGGGQAVPPNDAVSEVAGIAVRVPFRRRGIAAAITADITTRLFRAGTEIAWLEASGDDSWRIYERIGYHPTGNRLYLSRP